ncbi:hypothetical protein ACROYT_G031312 [Oculina patagonica]
MSDTLPDWSCSSGCTPPKVCRLKMCTNEVGLTSMRICVKDLTGTESQHDSLSVSYVVIGDGLFCSEKVLKDLGVVEIIDKTRVSSKLRDKIELYF